MPTPSLRYSAPWMVWFSGYPSSLWAVNLLRAGVMSYPFLCSKKWRVGRLFPLSHGAAKMLVSPLRRWQCCPWDDEQNRKGTPSSLCRRPALEDLRGPGRREGAALLFQGGVCPRMSVSAHPSSSVPGASSLCMGSTAAPEQSSCFPFPPRPEKVEGA